MAFFNKICKNKIGIQKPSTNEKEKPTKSSKLSLKKIISKPINKDTHKRKRIHHKTKSDERRKFYSKDDLINAVPSRENIKVRSRSHSISYDYHRTFDSTTVTPDKRTLRPVKNIDIKANIFWGEEYKKEQINLSIPRTSSYNSIRKIISEKLGYEISNDFAILYHTRKYHKDNIMRRILIDYWIKNKILWLIDDDFMLSKHLLLWRDCIEITVVRKSIIY
ncbi:unnamed protein product [Rhizophagus irregularis]|uniref:Uncharacterized protein n=1 Tax=Rhizophagus irregularis TaxID=588596 RepID=A0A2N1MLF3_9GLOM|nr:hypothetical protein RhiirC2_759595 [Rhizophagus irregularis]CAB4384716.1 unnamed protein product [Rhizophagus irregularis]CAB5378977.1 unnamed protein product [Rhizophagus irregularis]